MKKAGPGVIVYEFMICGAWDADGSCLLRELILRGEEGFENRRGGESPQGQALPIMVNFSTYQAFRKKIFDNNTCP